MGKDGYTFKILNNKAKNEEDEIIDVISMQVFADNNELLYTYSTAQILGTLRKISKVLYLFLINSLKKIQTMFFVIVWLIGHVK
ncbi:hypothetical protein JHL18_02430 [Clostridium sp. YIM B02505]|uniref:Uncharacterized protein n=1 Tax=Clostridium yunnanense TaxID=2800325 RepID=A0ABS1EJG1_9CLOT|nr:hypothetical protein [Clostridium yunnanense]MBK1809501.1 hypothetical protein [Clostridium yunnanense]